MVCISDVSRRILTFPAIRPCEAVSPASLVSSLITLSSNICRHKLELFVTNKRNVREAIRLVGLLFIFFEEIRENGSNCNMSDSAVLSLSELHFVLQKVQFLLEDCSRDNARLWTLVRCKFVANQFRIFMRALATALDVLPLKLMDVSIEAKDSISLAMNQARKSSFEVDSDDKLTCKNVLSVLSQLEDGIIPNSSDLRQILNQLGLLSWGNCNKEIKFLVSELGFEYSSSEKKDLGILSSLIGLMSYCRGVLCEEVDNVDTQRAASGCSSKVVAHLNPDDFRCPISLEIMTDPVTIATGHTYDRASILKWFKAGNPICPKTGERLTSSDLVPNLALKRLIWQYCSENGFKVGEKSGNKKRDIMGTFDAGSAAAEAAMRMLANFLASRLAIGSHKERNKVAFEIRLLTKSSIFNRSCLVEAGTIPHLLNLLHSEDSLTQESAIAALLNLSKHTKSKNIVVENGGVEAILKVLKEGINIEAKQHAAGTLFYLASVEEYRVSIGETPGAIPALMDLIRDGTDRGKKNALVAIFGLLMYPDNHWRVLSAGLVPLLTDLLKSFEREDLITDSLAVLATIAEKNDGTVAILRVGSLPMIVEILNSTISRAAKEYCVSLLLALCINGEADVVPLLVKNHALMGPLYALLTDGTSRASKKASSLIRLLHQYHERSSSSQNTPAFPRERFVHVW